MACTGCERRRKAIAKKADQVSATLRDRGLQAPANLIQRGINMLGWRNSNHEMVADRLEQLGQTTDIDGEE